MSGRLHAVEALLYDFDRTERRAVLTLDDHVPQLVTRLEGDCYLLDRASLRNLPGGPLRFYQEKPYRLDAGLLGEVGS
ncbi:hypothetical protein ACVWXO_008075 [Bradyrhizobium sp. LM2.7]